MNKEAEKKFKEITEAYNILSDPEKKKLYDQFGHAAFDQSGAADGAGGYGTGVPWWILWKWLWWSRI